MRISKKTKLKTSINVADTGLDFNSILKYAGNIAKIQKEDIDTKDLIKIVKTFKHKIKD